MTACRVALVAVIVLFSAGVGSAIVPAGSAPVSTPTPTATPGAETTTNESPNTTATTDSENTTATTDSENTSLPPGVNQSGVEEPSTLVAVHRAALNETGFRFEFQSNVSVGPASQWTTQRGIVEAGLSPLVVHSTSVREIDGETTTFATDLWATENVVIVQHSRGGRTDLQRYNRTSENVGVYDETWAHLPRADLDSQVTQSWLLELALVVGQWDLDRVEQRDGTQVAVLRATEPVAAVNFTDLNATLVVDADGRVRSLSLTATAAGDIETRIRYAFELTDFGSVEVERPPWVETVERANETTTADATTVNTTATMEVTATANTTTTANWMVVREPFASTATLTQVAPRA